MNLIYNKFSITFFDIEDIEFIYMCRNQYDFYNFWFFPNSKITLKDFLEEIKLLILDEVILDFFVLKYKDIRVGFLMLYAYDKLKKTVKFSIYIIDQYRKGFFLLRFSQIALYYCKNMLNLKNVIFEIYKANKFVNNFFYKYNFFKLENEDKIYLQYSLDITKIDDIFKFTNFNDNLVDIKKSNA